MRPASVGAIAAASFNTIVSGGGVTQTEHISSTPFGPAVSLVDIHEYPSSTAFGPVASEIAP